MNSLLQWACRAVIPAVVTSLRIRWWPLAGIGALLVITGSSCFGDDTLNFQQISEVSDEQIDESSGMAASYTHPNCLWLHNDSGDKPRLFLVGLDGETRAVVNVGGAEAFDWEDMCSFQMNGSSWLLIGDIGDNKEARSVETPACRLYLLKEPTIPPSNGQPTVRWPVTAMITFQYSDGSHDCESLAVDTERKEILLLTKKKKPWECGLYVLPLDLNSGTQRVVAQKIASPAIPLATAFDIAPDNRRLAVASMMDGIVVTRRDAESWADAFQRTPQHLPLPPPPERKQGETICFDPSGRWLYANSEKKREPLWKVDPNPPSESSDM